MSDFHFEATSTSNSITAKLQHQEEVSAHINRSLGLAAQPLQRSFVDVQMRPVPWGFQHEEILLQGAA